MSMSDSNGEFMETNGEHKGSIILFPNLLLPPRFIRGRKAKDTGDVIEEILILKTALLTDLFSGL